MVQVVRKIYTWGLSAPTTSGRVVPAGGGRGHSVPRFSNGDLCASVSVIPTNGREHAISVEHELPCVWIFAGMDVRAIWTMLTGECVGEISILSRDSCVCVCLVNDHTISRC